MTYRVILTLLLSSVVEFVLAQGSGGPPIPPPDAVAAPIDGGLSILLAAGAAYGAKKIYDYKKNNDRDL